MEDSSSLIPSQRPTETFDSSDHAEEHDHHQHHQQHDSNSNSNSNSNSDIIDDTSSTHTSSSKEPSDSCNSLTTCRKTGSLVDNDDDDNPVEDAPHHQVHDDDAPPSQQQQPDAVVHRPDHHPETTSAAMTTSSTTEDSSILQSPNTNETTQPSWTPPHSLALTTTTPLPVIQFSQQQGWLLNRRVPLPVHNWDHLRSSGDKIKTLVAEAMGQVQYTITTLQHQKNQSSSMKRNRDRGGLTEDTTIHDDDDDDHIESPCSKQPRVVNVADFTVELAREKTAQVLQLQRQLKDAQAQAAAVQAANASLREETGSGQSRLDRTVEALRIATDNAAKARADADAAEATAATLAQTLHNLKTVLTETKKASQILHEEQQELNAAVVAAESKFVQKEADLLQAKKEIAMLRTANATLETAQHNVAQERETLVRQTQQLEQECDILKQEKAEMNVMEQARKNRADKVEQEWRKAQTLLVEATSGQATTLQTQAALEQTVAALQTANAEVHASLKDHQRRAGDEKQRLTEALSRVEKEAQRLRIAAEATDEQLARYQAQQVTAEQHIQQLKSRLSHAEKRLVEAVATTTTTTLTPMSTNGAPDDMATTTTPIVPNQLSFQLPPLTTTSATGKKETSSSTTSVVPTITEKENLGAMNGELCCVCYKPSGGLMKMCQCGNPTCHKKAHTHCCKFIRINTGPSVSHPGTPAPKLPVVLCDHVPPSSSSRRPPLTSTITK